MTSPTLCHLIASNFAGGPEKQILEVSVRLRDRGWRVVVGSFRENREAVEVEQKARELGLPTFLVQTRSSFSPAAILQLRRHLRTHSVDLLVTHGYKSNLLGRLARTGAAVPQIPVVRGYTGADWKVKGYESLDRGLLKTFPLVLCVSDATREILVRHGLRRERIEVLHNAVDCSKAVAPVDLAAEFSLPARARVLVAAGRLSPEKGHRFLVEAMGRLVDDPSVHLIILGSGPEQGSLEQQIDRARLKGRVLLAGFRTDVLGCLAGADLVVNPSLTEGLPNVVLEAMAMRTAVVATDVGGVAEIIASRDTGWLVPAGDASSLAAAIGEALSDDDRRRAAAEAGHRRVEGNFTFEEQARRFEGICQRFLERGGDAKQGTEHA